MRVRTTSIGMALLSFTSIGTGLNSERNGPIRRIQTKGVFHFRAVPERAMLQIAESGDAPRSCFLARHLEEAQLGTNSRGVRRASTNANKRTLS
ncbi:hypothetical protein FB567DRAFT_520002 [Paraphoma chrysanthemicola]|uniref:Secreted protein n=1 Tax=Paraphoma chrysanthemicola TaxID=798071 RepID=A0A8K0RDP3_9PLEO|nr:hypothetical protein FB567DRAFT_520002 [Paraphoma chrysanthemicola]